MKKLFIFAFSTLISAQLFSLDLPFDIRGYGKSLLYFSDLAENTNIESTDEDPYSTFEDKPYTTFENTLRLSVLWNKIDWISFEAAWQISPVVVEKDLSLLGGLSPRVEPYRIADFDRRIVTEGKFYLAHDLDRLFFTFTTPHFDIYAGRQAISFGSAKAVNPTDILSPFAYQELSREEKIGVDAVRVRIPAGEMNEIDLGYVFGDDADFTKSAVYARGRFYLFETDVSIIAINFHKNLLLGFDMTRSLFDAGVWIEGAWTFTDFTSDGRDSDRDYLRLTAGIDYNFSCNLYTFIEYHYNGAGEFDAENYAKNISKPAYLEGGTYLLGKHYIAPGATYEIVPLLTGKMQLLINLTDPSAMIAPGIEYNITDNIYLEAGAYLSFGKKIEKKFIPEIHSEFGTYPNIYYLSAKAYF